MPKRTLLLLVAIGLLALPPAAGATTRHGITPLAPKAGSTVAVGSRPTFKMRVRGPGQVWVHVCKSKRRGADGVICNHDPESIGRARKRGGVYRYKPPFFDFPEFWLNSPGTYYWQAFRIYCAGSDCSQEGPIVRFHVG